MDTYRYVGLISGTSADGIDAALIEVPAEAGAAPRLTEAITHPYPVPLRTRVTAAIRATGIEYAELCELDTAVAESFADATSALLQRSGIPAARVRAVGSHGQTLFHHPDGPLPNTLQIGNPSVIAARTGIDTVADIRRADMAAGGQGAPLLPALHQRLFADAIRTRGVLNMGGIGNLTVLPAGADAPSAGFDTGPANTLLDALAVRHLNSEMDEDAHWASTGEVQEPLLAALLADPYFARPAPKSTGTEYFNLDWMACRAPHSGELRPQDVARTVIRLGAVSAADAINVAGVEELFVVGGGARNPLLMSDLESLSKCVIRSPHDVGVDADHLEAMAFGWFAHCYLERIPAMPQGVTGARTNTVLGALYPGGQSED